MLRLGKLAYQIMFIVILTLISIFYAGPYVWLIISSLKPSDEIFKISLPSRIVWDRFPFVFFSQHFYPTLINSLIVCFVSMVATLILATPASYALVRLKRLKLRHYMLMLFLLTFVFPQISYLGYIYLLISSAKLYNTILGLVITYTASQLAMMIWLLSSYVKGIPIEVEEAALIDGCDTLQVFTRIILPLLLPGLAVAAIFSFISLWGEFTVAFSISITNAARTVPIGVSLFTGVYELNWGEIAAACTIATIPPIILALLAQKFIIGGLTAGVGKEVR